MEARTRRRAWWAGLLALLVAALAAASWSSPTTPASAADSERKTLRVGTELTYKPYSYQAEGKPTGYDIDVMKAVADEAGYDVEFVQSQFDAIFAALDAGRVDLIANQITVNPEREAKYLFTRPYTYSRGVIVTAANNKEIKTLDDVRGKKAAENDTSNWAEVARDAGAEIQGVDGFAQAAELLAQGRVDVIVNDNIAVLDYLASTGNDEIKIVGDVDDEVSAQALVMRKDEAGLRDDLDQALQRLLADGTIKEISEGYFEADVSVEEGGGEVKPKGSSQSTRETMKDAAWPMLRGVLKGTIPLTVISFVAGLALALVTALARMSANPFLQWPARFYVSLIRGTPLLVQLFIVFYGFPQIGIRLDGFVSACLALSLNVGGYAAEIIRSSILSVPRGQFEAATTIGMDYRQTMRRIVLPQASRIAVPPLSNTLLSLIKDTSLASVVLVTEVFREAQIAAAASFDYLPLYLMAAAYFWVVCFIVSIGQGKLEKKLARYSV